MTVYGWHENNPVTRWLLPLVTLVFTGALSPFAQTDEPRFSLTAGAELTTGEYGGRKSIDDLYVPITLRYQSEGAAFRLTIPYLRVRAPTGTVTTAADGRQLVGEGPRRTESGLGDVIASTTFYDVITFYRSGVAVDLTGKVKFGTADEDKGLGTGENDYSFQTDIYKFVGNFTITGTVGYKFRGEPGNIDLDDAWLFSAGGSHKFSVQTRVGVFFDYRESSIETQDSVRELMALLSHRLNHKWRIQGYALRGLSDSSPDWGGGLFLSMDF